MTSLLAKLGLAFMSLSLSLGSVISAQTDAETGYIDLVVQGLLDVETPIEQRSELFRRLHTRADDGDAQCAYLLGTLYWRGLAPLNAIDLDQAERWLIRSLYAGGFNAFPKLVEVNLAAGQALTAMAWTQLYARFVTRALDASDTRFAAGLIVRVAERLPEQTSDQAIGQAIAELLVDHGAPLERAVAAWNQSGSGALHPDLIVRSTPRRQVPDRLLRGDQRVSTLVEVLVEVRPDGKTARTWLIDAWPNQALGPWLQAYAGDTRYNAIDVEHMRYALHPFQFDDQAGFRLKHQITVKRRRAGQSL
jgi:hypothetical protein